jgi:hypothetical protein
MENGAVADNAIMLWPLLCALTSIVTARSYGGALIRSACMLIVGEILFATTDGTSSFAAPGLMPNLTGTLAATFVLTCLATWIAREK